MTTLLAPDTVTIERRGAVTTTSTGVRRTGTPTTIATGVSCLIDAADPTGLQAQHEFEGVVLYLTHLGFFEVDVDIKKGDRVTDQNGDVYLALAEAVYAAGPGKGKQIGLAVGKAWTS